MEKKKKSATLSDRLMNEGDLISPNHDEIMILLEQKMPMVLNEMINQRVKEDLNFRDELKYSITWESPIRKDSGDIIGFIDMQVNVSNWPSLYRDGVNDSKEFFLESKKIMFEVKTKIRSVGELLRQLRFYDANKSGTYVVVSPDDKYRSVIESQGFKFINSNDLREL